MTTGDIVGIVTDSSGAVVPSARITAKLIATNETHTATTGQTGQYRFSLMPPGEYEVSGEATGLKSKTERFMLLAGQETAINLKLEVQGTTELIEVQAQATILQTENANLATGFNTSQLNNLPTMGGDLTTMAFTVPGVLVLPGGGASGNFNVNGIPGATALFTLNGTDDMDPYLNINNSGASNNLLGQNEVAEASVILNAYSADFGRMTGAQVNFISKTGTNSFHGDLFHNYNDKAFNANDFYNTLAGLQQPRSDSHQFGGNFGGPIKKNKLFFFFDYESLQYALPASASTVYIPSAQLQAYTLAHIPAADTSLYNQAFALWNGSPGASSAVPVTNGNGIFQDGNGVLGCGTGTFPGTKAPNGGTFGVNVSCTNVFAANASQINKESFVIPHIDYNVTDKQRLSFRYQYDWGVQATGPSFINHTFDETSNQPSNNGQVTYTYAITPNLVNNVIPSFMWYSAKFGYTDLQKALSLMPVNFSVSDFCCAGLGVATNMPQGRNVGQIQLVDDLTWSHGNHTVKAGVNYRYNQVTDFTNNELAFSGQYTFADLTDFATGQVNSTGYGSSFRMSFPNLLQVHLRMSSLGLYAQDTWKVRRNITVTFGLRGEHDGNPSCLDNCFARMNTQFGMSGYTGGLTVPYNQTITTGLHNLYTNLQSVAWEPRGSIAWSSPDSKTVFRAGFGMFANLFAGSVASSVFRNAPSVFTPTVSTVPAGAVSAGNAGPPSDPNSAWSIAIAANKIFTSQFSSGGTLASIRSALGSIPFALPSYYSPPAEFVPPKTAEWSAEIERSISSHDVVAITYAGNHGYDQPMSNTWSNSYLLLASNGLNKYYGTNFGGATPLPTSAPDPRFLTVTQVLLKGYSNYDGGTLQLRHSMKYGLQGQIAWTWAHGLQDGTVYDPYNLHFGYGNSSIDVRHAIVSDLTWSEPHKFANGVLNQVLGGWNFGWKLYIYTGRPTQPTDSKIGAQINSGGGTGATPIATVIDPNTNPVCTSRYGTADTKCWNVNQFMTYNNTTAAYKAGVPIQTDFGGTGPGVFRGPGYFDFDTTLYKRFTIKEKYGLQFGADFFNLFNHPNFTTPTGSISSSYLGFVAPNGTLAPPTSPYGSGQGAIVTGRVIVVNGKFSF